MKYFVSGGSGFIGKAVVSFLEKQGHEVLKYDRDWKNDLAGCDIVVHLAAYGNHYFQNEPEKIVVANILDLIELVTEAKDAGIKKFYNASTSSVTLPTQTMYSASKLFGETFINSLKDERFVNVRPYSVYGEGEAQHRFIPTVIRHLKSGQEMPLDPYAVHDFIHVDDFVKAMFDGHTSIGSGVQCSNLFIVSTLEEISGKKLKYVPTQMRNYDTEKWVCPTPVPCRSLKDGLKQTFDYYNK